MASNPAQPALDSMTTRNPVLEQYLKNKPKSASQQLSRDAADIAKNSIFVDLEKAPGMQLQTKVRNREHMNVILDPDPHGRMRWERKMIIRQIRRRGRLTKVQLLKQTERESVSKSQMIKTSVKKLGMLARQIVGKPIEEAITQMRFSPKKAAKAVAQHLKFARDEAIVKRGMGLGEAEDRKGEPVEIELKDGKRKFITDRTGIYVDQAWVGKGPYDTALDYRARGRVNIMRLPYTSKLMMRTCCELALTLSPGISVLLKEEATRIRLSEERQKKRENKKLWVQLPDRPITQQRQYPLW